MFRLEKNRKSRSFQFFFYYRYKIILSPIPESFIAQLLLAFQRARFLSKNYRFSVKVTFFREEASCRYNVDSAAYYKSTPSSNCCIFDSGGSAWQCFLHLSFMFCNVWPAKLTFGVLGNNIDLRDAWFEGGNTICHSRNDESTAAYCRSVICSITVTLL